MMFLYPAFLFALLAVLIPIAVHLFNLHRYRKEYFSNVRRLEEMQQQTRRQRNLRQLLLLASRVLSVTFLVLAFCQPVLLRKEQLVRRGGAAVSVYVDNSFSMSNVGREGSLLQQAVQKAREIASAYKSSDRFQLLTSDMLGRQFRWLSRDEFLAALDEVKPSSATPLLSEVAQRQADFLRSVSANDWQAYVISDFQVSSSDFGALKQDSLVATTLVPLEAQGVNNLFVDSLSLGAPVFYKGALAVAVAYLRNEGDSQVESVPVRLFLDGRQRAMASTSVDAHSTVAVELPFTIDATGPMDGRVEISDYPITFDDTLFFALNVRSRINMLEVDGGEPNPYLQSLFSGDSAIFLRYAGERSIDYGSLNESNFIVLNGLKDIPSGLAQTLHDFVEDGGSVLVVPPVAAYVASYNSMLSLFSAPRLGGWMQGERKAVGVDTRALLYSNVFSRHDDPMELPTLKGSYSMVYDGGTIYQPLISLADGGYYLALTPCGSGNLYLLASPLDEQNTDFVRQALFVPTLYNMALYSVAPGSPYATLGSLAPVTLSHYYPIDDVPLLTSSSQAFSQIPDLRRVGGRCLLMPHAVALAGNYRLALQDGNCLHEAVAFNYSRVESVMQFLSRGEVSKTAKDYNLTTFASVLDASRPLDAAIKVQREGVPLWRWCLAISLMFLAVEVFLLRKIKLPHVS
ncbi:MAG: BatA domain-containing protein [Bacteroidales bacterium]|nr:BatA domain-containing protein [Bacteroidales bacterium]